MLGTALDMETGHYEGGPAGLKNGLDPGSPTQPLRGVDAREASRERRSIRPATELARRSSDAAGGSASVIFFLVRLATRVEASALFLKQQKERAQRRDRGEFDQDMCAPAPVLTLPSAMEPPE